MHSAQFEPDMGKEKSRPGSSPSPAEGGVANQSGTWNLRLELVRLGRGSGWGELLWLSGLLRLGRLLSGRLG
ncbi:hypothetical protein StoSoilB22_13520 [Arthrobacter sp. StoSoilB22]|nr:hypothetical protein StoSoilB22_13520 [Arthrobacter sp. StoSoilB22]